jgi:hypothetical protein
VIVFGLGVVLTIAAWRRLTGVWRLAVMAHLGYAAVAGSNVWMRWEGFSRVLLPLYVLGVIALLPTESSGGGGVLVEHERTAGLAS